MEAFQLGSGVQATSGWSSWPEWSGWLEKPEWSFEPNSFNEQPNALKDKNRKDKKFTRKFSSFLAFDTHPPSTVAPLWLQKSPPFTSNQQRSPGSHLRIILEIFETILESSSSLEIHLEIIFVSHTSLGIRFRRPLTVTCHQDPRSDDLNEPGWSGRCDCRSFAIKCMHTVLSV